MATAAATVAPRYRLKGPPRQRAGVAKRHLWPGNPLLAGSGEPHGHAEAPDGRPPPANPFSPRPPRARSAAIAGVASSGCTGPCRPSSTTLARAWAPLPPPPVQVPAGTGGIATAALSARIKKGALAPHTRTGTCPGGAPPLSVGRGTPCVGSFKRGSKPQAGRKNQKYKTTDPQCPFAPHASTRKRQYRCPRAALFCTCCSRLTSVMNGRLQHSRTSCAWVFIRWSSSSSMDRNSRWHPL